MAERQQRGDASAAEFPPPAAGVGYGAAKRRRSGGHRSEPDGEQLGTGRFGGIQSGHSGTPALRSTPISSHLVPEDRHAR